MIEVSAKTLNDAIIEACQQLEVPSDRLYYEVVEEGSAGFLGIGAKAAVIKACIKGEEEVVDEEAPVAEEVAKEATEEVAEEAPVAEEKKPAKAAKAAKPAAEAATVEAAAKKFLADVFAAMEMEVVIEAKYDEAEHSLEVVLNGEDMGVLIGKRGQTLDSVQYLTSLVVNKEVSDYIRVKVDTENYRERRKETLENLAKNIAYKVKRNRKAVALEPMNPYERRIIHSVLQNDKYVTTHSEGEEPYRKVVVSPKFDKRDRY